MISLRDIVYLEWIFNRLLYKFKDDNKYIDTAKIILNKIKRPQISISDDNLNRILGKYFVDFNLQKTETIGFNDSDRKELRTCIRSIIQDILSNNIPKNEEILIK
jgi:hypothetical protein